MNIQACIDPNHPINGFSTRWQDFGDVTHSAAAEALVARITSYEGDVHVLTRRDDGSMVTPLVVTMGRSVKSRYV